jgi:hypothetical protein
MSIDSVVTAYSTCDLFGELVRTPTAFVIVMGSNPDVHVKSTSEVLYTEELVAEV